MPKKSSSAHLRYLRDHGPVLALLLVLVYGLYRRLMVGDFWNPPDFEMLLDANRLAHDPLQMFRHIGTYFSQPLLQLAFLLEYHTFGVNFAPYIAVNLAVHVLNAFIVYMLVNMLFPGGRMALLAAVLFAVGVGSYGKSLQAAVKLEGLLLASFHLLVLYFLIRNDFRRRGRLRSPYFIWGLIIFGLAGLTKASTISILGCILAYKLFFFQDRQGRRILSADVIILVAIGVLFAVGQHYLGWHGPRIIRPESEALAPVLVTIKNVFRYLGLMILPMQESSLLDAAGPVVQAVYDLRHYFYPVLLLAIVSFSFFGFVFGGRSLRFFIAWTFIALLPFSGQHTTGVWLNLNHLYLASLGFCVVLSAGALGVFRLLAVRRWRRWLAFALPAMYLAGAIALTYRLDERNDHLARSPRIEGAREALLQVIASDRTTD
jgi:hypothetical protein